MYNRYVPQSDGSYRRSSIREQRREPPPEPSSPDPRPIPGSSEPPDCQPPPEYRPRPPKAVSYLRNLLPADLDTEDLLVILLLLLMTGEGRDGGNLPLLTLALYLFL